MYKVQFRNDRGDWIRVDKGRRGFFYTRKAADKEAARAAEAGYTARILSEGRIFHYYERRAK